MGETNTNIPPTPTSGTGTSSVGNVYIGIPQPEKIRIYFSNPFFNGFKDNIESLVDNITLNIYVFDLNENYLLTLEDISPSLWWTINNEYIEIDLYNTLQYNGILNGSYKIIYQLFNNLLGDINRKMFISDISNSRTEIRIKQTEDISDEEVIHFSSLPKIDQNNNALEFNAKINESDYRIINIRNEYKEDRDPKYSFIFKLLDPLANDINIGDFVHVTLPLTQEFTKKISVYPINIEQTATLLKTPNFNIKINDKSNEQSSFKNWNQLISENESTSNKILSKYFSTSSKGIPLNVDFKDFNNFVFYSSATKRLEAFKYKLTKIEQLDGSIASMYNAITPASSSLTGSTAFVKNINKFKDKKLEILKSFDLYENYLFYESSSYESSSFGEYYSSSWPKYIISSSIYSPYSVTSSVATLWYDGVYSSASLFDRTNSNKLTNLIPFHIQDDPLNSDYITFVEFVSHQFDEIWIYANHHENFLKNRDESLYVGLAKDLIYSELRSYGWDGINEHQFEDLWYYSLGTDEAGNSYSTGSWTANEQFISASNLPIPRGDISKEFWKRILNNLPYLRKTQGTKEGIRSLINCYGIPPTILRIKEYGGPNKPGIASYSQFDKFTYALDFDQDNESYVDVAKNSLVCSGLSPNIFEFRFKTINANNYLSGIPTSLKRQVLFKKSDNNIIINLVHTNGVFGNLNIILSGCTTSTCTLGEGPFFNGEWWSFMFRHNESNDNNLLEHTFDVYVKMARWYDISHAYSSSFTLDGTDPSSSAFVTLGLLFENAQWYLGGGPRVGSNYPFHGQMQGLKYWGTTITENTFNNHVTAPATINGDTYTDSFNYLGLYFPLGIDLKTANHYVTQSIYSKHPNFNITTFDSYGELTGSMVNFPDENNYVPVYDYYSMTFPDVSGNRLISNKIRIEENIITGSLSPYKRSEVSSFDIYPSDNPKFGVYFSTTNETNDDIAEQFDGLNIDDYLGDWNNFFSGSYPGLHVIRNHYFQKFNNSYGVYDYIRLMKFYNNSLFNHIKETTPARAKKLVGYVVEPHILNRSKVSFASSEPVFTSLAMSASIAQTIFMITGSTPTIVSGSMQMIYSISGEMNNTGSRNGGAITGSLNINFEQTPLNNDSINFLLAASQRSNDYSYGMREAFFDGCKLTAPAINTPSLQTPDGGPVITINQTNSNTLQITQTTAGTNLKIVNNPVIPSSINEDK